MTETETSSATFHEDQSSLFLGLVVCWLLNMAHLGIAYLIFAGSERLLPSVFVLVGAIGLLQIGYVAPVWYFLKRRGKKRMATGFAVAAGITLLFNASFLLYLYVNGS